MYQQFFLFCFVFFQEVKGTVVLFFSGEMVARQQTSVRDHIEGDSFKEVILAAIDLAAAKPFQVKELPFS